MSGIGITVQDSNGVYRKAFRGRRCVVVNTVTGNKYVAGIYKDDRRAICLAKVIAKEIASIGWVSNAATNNERPSENHRNRLGGHARRATCVACNRQPRTRLRWRLRCLLDALAPGGVAKVRSGRGATRSGERGRGRWRKHLRGGRGRQAPPAASHCRNRWINDH